MYKIVGSDQKEYGPVSSDQIREWIGQGRANGQSVASFEGSPWKPLSTFPEFADALRAVAPPPLGGSVPGSLYGGASRRSNTAAIAGLVLGISGICCCFPFFSMLGVIFSAIGWVQIRRSPQIYSTHPAVAVTGLVLSLAWIVFFVVAFSTGALDEALRKLQASGGRWHQI